MSRDLSLINPGQPTRLAQRGVSALMAQNGDPGALACDWSLRPTPKQGSCRSPLALIGCPRGLTLTTLGPTDTPRNTRHARPRLGLTGPDWARPGLNVVRLCWRHEAAANVSHLIRARGSRCSALTVMLAPTKPNEFPGQWAECRPDEY